jgi:hypothetical protein
MEAAIAARLGHLPRPVRAEAAYLTTAEDNQVLDLQSPAFPSFTLSVPAFEIPMFSCPEFSLPAPPVPALPIPSLPSATARNSKRERECASWDELGACPNLRFVPPFTKASRSVEAHRKRRERGRLGCSAEQDRASTQTKATSCKTEPRPPAPRVRF